jgi:DNA gyrase inhibitor GyrI
MMGRELPRGGFTPDERPCFEMYLNDPSTHPLGLHDVEIWVAVKD